MYSYALGSFGYIEIFVHFFSFSFISELVNLCVVNALIKGGD
jgi:hypothetical protein